MRFGILLVVPALSLVACQTSSSPSKDGELRGDIDAPLSTGNRGKPDVSRLGIDYSTLLGIAVSEHRELRRLEGEDFAVVASAIRKADQEAEFNQGRFRRPDGRVLSIAADAILKLEFKDGGSRELQVFAVNSPFILYDLKTDVTFSVPLERKMLLHWFEGTRVHK